MIARHDEFAGEHNLVNVFSIGFAGSSGIHMETNPAMDHAEHGFRL